MPIDIEIDEDGQGEIIIGDADEGIEFGALTSEKAAKDAIRSVGRAKDPAAAKRWIKKRAKEMGKEATLPEDWK